MLLENWKWDESEEDEEDEEDDAGWDYSINNAAHDYGHNLWDFFSDPLPMKSYDAEDDNGY